MNSPDAKAAIIDNPRGRSCGTCAYVGIDKPTGTVVCKCYPPSWNGTAWVSCPVDPRDWCGQYAGPVPTS
jgi:hypothetical protein